MSPGVPMQMSVGSTDVFPTLELVMASILLHVGSSLLGEDCPGICHNLSTALLCSFPNSFLERVCASLPAQPLPSAHPQVLSRDPWAYRVSSQALLLTLFCSPAHTHCFQPCSNSLATFLLAKIKSFCKVRNSSPRVRAVPETGRGENPACPQSFSLPLGPFSLEKKSFYLFKSLPTCFRLGLNRRGVPCKTLHR